MVSGGYIDTMPLVVRDHAMWRAAERFPHFDTATIEAEVRDAIKAGRVTHDRRDAGLSAGYVSKNDLYVWTPDGVRVYAIRLYRERAVVYTTMRRNGT